MEGNFHFLMKKGVEKGSEKGSFFLHFFCMIFGRVRFAQGAQFSKDVSCETLDSGVAFWEFWAKNGSRKGVENGGKK